MRAPGQPCPACLEESAFPVVDRHTDPFTGTRYQLLRCGCGVVFSSPAVEAGASWYEQAVPEEPSLPPERDWRYRYFLADVPAGGALLDVGCGDGVFLDMARRAGFPRCLGFDWDKRRIARAQALGLEACAEDWASFCAGQADGAFTTITIFDVLEHFPRPAQALVQLRRMLAPGGRLVVTLPNADRPLPFGREDYDYPPHHFTRWTGPALRSFLERSGFDILRQDASMKEVFYFLDVMVARCALRPAVAAVKKLLFKGASLNGATVTQLYERGGSDNVLAGALAKPGLRKRLFAAYARAARIIFWPAAACLALGYGLLRRDSGPSLYVVAQKK